MHNSAQLQELSSKVQALKDQHFPNSGTLEGWLTSVNEFAKKKGVGFLGPSRSGKSSLLNNLLGDNFLPDSSYLAGKGVASDRGTTSVVTEIIVNRSLEEYHISVLLIEEEWHQSIRPLFEKMILEKDEKCTDPDFKKLVTTFLETELNIVDIPKYLAQVKDEKFQDPVLAYVRGHNFVLKFVADTKKKVREYLTNYGAGKHPVSVLAHRVLVEGPFPKSNIHNGAVLIDIPGSNDLNERREAQRVIGIREIKKAILLCPENISSKSTKKDLKYMIGEKLFQQSLVVKTRFLTPGVVKKWKKKGVSKENLGIKLGEAGSQEALNLLIRSELKCNAEPPRCLCYDHFTDDLDEEYNINVLRSITNHLNTLTVDETEFLERLPLVLAKVADETCTAQPIKQITLDAATFTNLATHWQNSVNGVSTYLTKIILEDSLQSYQSNYHNWRSARNWAYELRMLPPIRRSISKALEQSLNQICVSLRQWITDITKSYALPLSNDNLFFDGLRSSFESNLTDVLEIIRSVVDNIQLDAYVSVKQRGGNTPSWGSPSFKYLEVYRTRIESPVIQSQLRNALRRAADRTWNGIQTHLQIMTSKMNSFITSTPFVAQLDQLNTTHVAGISAILDLVDNFNTFLSCGDPPHAVQDNILQVGPRFKSQNVITLLEEQLKAHPEVTVVILRFLTLNQDDLKPLVKLISSFPKVTAIDFSGNELSLANIYWGFSINAVAAAFMVNTNVIPQNQNRISIRYHPARTAKNAQGLQTVITPAHWIIIYDSTLLGAVAGSKHLIDFCVSKQLTYSAVDITQPNAWHALVQEGKSKLLNQPLALYFACHGGMSCGGVSVISANGIAYSLADLIDGTARHPCAIILDSCQSITNTAAEDILGSCLVAQSAPTKRVAFDNTKYVQCLVEEFNRSGPLHSAIANAHRNFSNMNIGELPILKIYGAFPVHSFFWPS